MHENYTNNIKIASLFGGSALYCTETTLFFKDTPILKAWSPHIQTLGMLSFFFFFFQFSQWFFLPAPSSKTPREEANDSVVGSRTLSEHTHGHGELAGMDGGLPWDFTHFLNMEPHHGNSHVVWHIGDTSKVLPQLGPGWMSVIHCFHWHSDCCKLQLEGSLVFSAINTHWLSCTWRALGREHK